MYLGTTCASLAATGILHHPPGAGATPLALISSERRCCFLRGAIARSTPGGKLGPLFLVGASERRKMLSWANGSVPIGIASVPSEDGVWPVRLAIIAVRWRSRWRLIQEIAIFHAGAAALQFMRGSEAELKSCRVPSMRSSVGARLGRGSSRYQVYDPIALGVQVAQERGHHSCRPRLRIVQQNDSLFGDLELLDHLL